MRFSLCRTLIISGLILFSVNHAHAGLILNHPNYWELTSGLVGYWSFDGNDMNATQALDRSGQSNDGTLTNGPTRTEGKLGQALNFDGVDDYVNIAQTSRLAIYNQVA